MRNKHSRHVMDFSNRSELNQLAGLDLLGNVLVTAPVAFYYPKIYLLGLWLVALSIWFFLMYQRSLKKAAKDPLGTYYVHGGRLFLPLIILILVRRAVAMIKIRMIARRHNCKVNTSRNSIWRYGQVRLNLNRGSVRVKITHNVLDNYTYININDEWYDAYLIVSGDMINILDENNKLIF